MKIKKGYILRVVAKQNVVLPATGDLDLDRMLTLNATGKYLWERLEQEATKEDLVRAMLEHYEIEEDTARTCVENFVKNLEHYGFLEQ
jgi:methyltransferase-like protein